MVEFGDEIGKYMLYSIESNQLFKEIRDGRAKKYMNKCTSVGGRITDNITYTLHYFKLQGFHAFVCVCVCVWQQGTESCDILVMIGTVPYSLKFSRLKFLRISRVRARAQKFSPAKILVHH